MLRIGRSVVLSKRRRATSTRDFVSATAATAVTRTRISSSLSSYYLNHGVNSTFYDQQKRGPVPSSHTCCNCSTTRYFSTSPSTTTTTTDIDQSNTTTDLKTTIPKSPSSSPSWPVLFKAHLDLAKYKLSALVVSTTAMGYCVGGGLVVTSSSLCPSGLITLAAVSTGTALCAASGAAWNQIVERSLDARMKRTRQRPLVTNVISVQHAQIMATLWGVGGTTLLMVGTNLPTALLGAGNILLYSGVYTWLKQQTVYNTWVGALVGAIPPLMGYTAAMEMTDFSSLLNDHHGADALFLMATLYCWQMPHFLALSYLHREDYRRGGFEMVGTRWTAEETARCIHAHAILYATLPFASTLMGMTSPMYAMEAVVLHGILLKQTNDFTNNQSNAKARRIFMTSLWHLPCMLMLFCLHLKEPSKEKEENAIMQVNDKNILVIADGKNSEQEEENVKSLYDVIVTPIRNYLRETVCHHPRDQPHACPVVLAKDTTATATTTTTTMTEGVAMVPTTNTIQNNNNKTFTTPQSDKTTR